MVKPYFTLFLLSLIVNTSYGTPPDSVTVPASTKYSKPGILKKVFIGSNYRKEWGQPVRMKVFDISKEKGGFTIKKLGGGMQTKSLKIVDKSGIEWSLRSVDKDPSKAVEAKGQSSPFVKKVVQDMISAGYPYGAFPIPTMNRTLGVIAAEPELFFVPDDTAFGEFRELFANTVCMLEREEPTVDNTEALKTEKLEKELEEKGGSIDQSNLLQARLIDMLVADWDRHGEQWQWGASVRDGRTVYYAIPKDRDQAFFNYNGVMIRMVRPFTIKHLIGFKKRCRKLKTLNIKEWHFDRIYMNELGEDEWKKGIENFQAKLTDSVLETAMRQMPPEIYEVSGKKVLRKLEKRRDGMLKNGMKYYRFIDDSVIIRGSNNAEIYKIANSGNDLEIKVYEAGSNKMIYSRKINKSTKVIRLEGLGGDDVFQVDSDVNSKVKINLRSGEGRDTYNIKGRVKLFPDEETKKEMGLQVQLPVQN